jgi:PAS domain S-box-containing protein
MPIMRAAYQKIKHNRVLFVELLFTGAAFFTMAVLSYLFMGGIIHDHIRTRAENELTLAQERLESEFILATTVLNVFSETAGGMILQGVSADQLREYIQYIADGMEVSVDRFSRFRDFILYYDDPVEGPVIVNSIGDYPGIRSPSDSIWYRRAMEAYGDIIEMPPYFDGLTGNIVFTCARCIHDHSGKQLGVARVDILIGNIRELLAGDVAGHGGFGLLIDQDLTVLSHPNEDFIGTNLRTNYLPFSVFTEELSQGHDIGEGKMTDYLGFSSVGFFRKLKNGCYLGLVLPEKPYYENITAMRWMLSLLALAFAVIVITVLIRLNLAKERSDAESRQKNALTKVATAFLSHNEENFHDAITEGAEDVSAVIDLDTISVWRNHGNDNDSYTSQIYRWDRESGKTVKMDQGLNAISLPRLALRFGKNLEAGEFVNSPVNLLPKAFFLRSAGIASVFIAPVIFNNVTWGGVVYGDMRNKRFFDAAQAELMRSAAYLFANAAIREEMRLELAEQNEMNRVMFSTAPIGFVMFDENYNFIECNEYMAAMCGVTKEYYMEHFFDLSPEYQSDGSKSSDKAREILKQALEGKTITKEWTHYTSSGEPVPCEITVTRIKNKDKFIGLGYVYDLRNIRKLEQSVIEAEERVKLILDATPLSCDLWDRNYKLFDCNAAAVKLFGVRDRQEYLDNFFDFSPEYQGDGTRSEEKAVMLLKEAFDSGSCTSEWMHRLSDGTPVPAQVIAARLEYRGYYIVAVYTIDMREHKRMLKEIENSLLKAQGASRAKSEFLSRMSHEMLTPMNAIMGMTQLVQTLGVTGKTKDYINSISTASRDLLRMINDVLDMSSIEYDVLRLDVSVFSFQEMVNNAMRVVERIIETKQQKFTADIDPLIPSRLASDVKRLTQVISNLLTNAVKFTPECGEVNFAARLLDHDTEKITLQMEITDNGIGIPEEQQNGIFDLFEQVDGGNSRKFGGIGLGLAFSKRIIEMMDGRIWVDSEPGKGSKFTFTCKLNNA